ncbi:uncharacterized protein LOC111031033 [Myzus persicae]|uniref:uncharacterized protein LOC111031033 n=1 Tax=Myzus persicae TaxID=13164 RepID=UPI000B9332E7|nr:uncharacterized protein LOC111031033 [Myzus persicae]
MSTMVAVTVALTFLCVFLVKPLSGVHDYGPVSVVSDVKAPPIFTPSEMKILHPVNQHDNRRLEDAQNLGPTDNGSNHSQTYNHDHSSTHTDSLESESKKNISVDLQNTIHDMNDKDLEEIENPNEENGWTTLFKPEQTLISNLTSSEIIENVDGLSRPSFEKGVLNPPSKYDEDGSDLLTRQANRVPEVLNLYYAPSIGFYRGSNPLILKNGEMSVLVQSGNTNPQVTNMNPEVIILPDSPTNPQTLNVISPETSNIMNVQIPTPISLRLSNLNWRRVSLLLAFIKLGLVKLKSVGFIKIILFFLFKLKISLMLVFFKTISIFNMLLFSKFVMLPLFILPLIPIIVSMISPKFMIGLLSIPGKIIKYNMVLGPSDFGKIAPTSINSTETNSSISA